jgi:hypothetical protein
MRPAKPFVANRNTTDAAQGSIFVSIYEGSTSEPFLARFRGKKLTKNLCQFGAFLFARLCFLSAVPLNNLTDASLESRKANPDEIVLELIVESFARVSATRSGIMKEFAYRGFRHAGTGYPFL